MDEPVAIKRRLRSLDEFEPPPWQQRPRRRSAFAIVLIVVVGIGFGLGALAATYFD